MFNILFSTQTNPNKWRRREKKKVASLAKNRAWILFLRYLEHKLLYKSRIRLIRCDSIRRFGYERNGSNVFMCSCGRLWVCICVFETRFVCVMQRKASHNTLNVVNVSAWKESAGIWAITLFVLDHFEFVFFFYLFGTVPCSSHMHSHTTHSPVFHLGIF